ncbi:MAG TPA: hypothetical protein VMU64_14270 [Acidimicrobiales bacterium]|nr:hypothetical protein [Acidimicrobiales bacterium]
MGPLVVDPSSGFRNDADKIAYIEGAIKAPGTFPRGPGQVDGYPIISATEAFERLTFRKKTPAPSDALEVTAVRLGAAVFQTDRGPHRLPAWLFAIQNVRDTAKVLAVSPTSIFTARTTLDGRPPSVADARLGPDGRTLTVQFAGEPAGTRPCTADYDLSVTESRTTVSVTVHEHAHDSEVPCAQPASVRQATTRLAAPLGVRVVLDGATSTAVAVTGADPPS